LQETNILFICKGNICRSPFAEAVLSNDFNCKSAGTENYHAGKGANKNAIEIAKEFGIDLSKHIARQVNYDDIQWAHVLFVMESQNEFRLRSLLPKIPSETTIYNVGHFYKENFDVPDPFKRQIDDFRNTFKIILESCEKIKTWLNASYPEL
jgi:protein-tyrosine phosphatase